MDIAGAERCGGGLELGAAVFARKGEGIFDFRFADMGTTDYSEYSEGFEVGIWDVGCVCVRRGGGECGGGFKI